MKLLSSGWFLFILGLWQLAVVLTPVSLYGFWTDVLVFAAWTARLAFLVLSGRLRPKWMDVINPAIIGSAMLGLALGLPVLAFSSMSMRELFHVLELSGTRSVPQADKLQGAYLVNQYFIPTSAYGCGMGKLITAKAPVFFPLFEWRTEFDPCTHEDWGYLIEHGSWEGWANGPIPE